MQTCYGSSCTEQWTLARLVCNWLAALLPALLFSHYDLAIDKYDSVDVDKSSSDISAIKLHNDDKTI